MVHRYYYAKKVEQASVYIRYGLIERGQRRMMANSINVMQVRGVPSRVPP